MKKISFPTLLFTFATLIFMKAHQNRRQTAWQSRKKELSRK
jgi:hypothetical protein